MFIIGSEDSSFVCFESIMRPVTVVERKSLGFFSRVIGVSKIILSVFIISYNVYCNSYFISVTVSFDILMMSFAFLCFSLSLNGRTLTATITLSSDPMISFEGEPKLLYNFMSRSITKNLKSQNK